MNPWGGIPGPSSRLLCDALDELGILSKTVKNSGDLPAELSNLSGINIDVSLVWVASWLSGFCGKILSCAKKSDNSGMRWGLGRRLKPLLCWLIWLQGVTDLGWLCVLHPL